MTARLYYEAHVTIEPVFGQRLLLASAIAVSYHFRVADLLMQKREEDTPERSKFDTFMTGRHKEYDVLYERMESLINTLEDNGFVVWRAKIEDTLFDTKHGDSLNHNNTGVVGMEPQYKVVKRERSSYNNTLDWNIDTWDVIGPNMCAACSSEQEAQRIADAMNGRPSTPIKAEQVLVRLPGGRGWLEVDRLSTANGKFVVHAKEPEHLLYFGARQQGKTFWQSILQDIQRAREEIVKAQKASHESFEEMKNVAVLATHQYEALARSVLPLLKNLEWSCYIPVFDGAGKEIGAVAGCPCCHTASSADAEHDTSCELAGLLDDVEQILDINSAHPQRPDLLMNSTMDIWNRESCGADVGFSLDDAVAPLMQDGVPVFGPLDDNRTWSVERGDGGHVGADGKLRTAEAGEFTPLPNDMRPLYYVLKADDKIRKGDLAASPVGLMTLSEDYVGRKAGELIGLILRESVVSADIGWRKE